MRQHELTALRSAPITVGPRVAAVTTAAHLPPSWLAVALSVAACTAPDPAMSGRTPLAGTGVTATPFGDPTADTPPAAIREYLPDGPIVDFDEDIVTVPLTPVIFRPT